MWIGAGESGSPLPSAALWLCSVTARKSRCATSRARVYAPSGVPEPSLYEVWLWRLPKKTWVCWGAASRTSASMAWGLGGMRPGTAAPGIARCVPRWASSSPPSRRRTTRMRGGRSAKKAGNYSFPERGAGGAATAAFMRSISSRIASSAHVERIGVA